MYNNHVNEGTVEKHDSGSEVVHASMIGALNETFNNQSYITNDDDFRMSRSSHFTNGTLKRRKKAKEKLLSSRMKDLRGVGRKYFCGLVRMTQA